MILKMYYWLSNFIKPFFAKDYPIIEKALVDTVTFSLEDGSTIKGKEAAMEYMKKAFTQMTVNIFIKYNVYFI